jgi:hypothetical protein
VYDCSVWEDGVAGVCGVAGCAYLVADMLFEAFSYPR